MSQANLNGHPLSVWFLAAVTEDSRGGVARNVRALADGLRQRGHEVTVFFARTNENPFVLGLRCAGRLLAAPRPCVIIARSFDGLFCSLVTRLLRLRTKVLLHNHGWEDRAHQIERSLAIRDLPPRTTFRATLARFPLVRFAERMSHALICGTVGEMRWARTAHRYAGPLVFVPNGVEAPVTVNRDPISALRFLCVGPHTWKKNLRTAVGLIARVRAQDRDARMTLVGCGASAAQDPCIRERVTEGWLQLVESAPPEEMTTWYASASFVITTSSYEGGHPLTVLEAMAHGCLVFASGIPAHCEVIRHQTNGILLSGRIEEDGATILSFLDRPESSLGIRHRAIQTARHRRWSRQVDRLEKALRRV